VGSALLDAMSAHPDGAVAAAAAFLHGMRRPA